MSIKSTIEDAKEKARQRWLRWVSALRGKNYVAPRSMTEAEKAYYAIHKNLTNFNRCSG